MWKWIGCEIFETYATLPHPTSYEWNWLAFEFELSWTTYKEREMTTFLNKPGLIIIAWQERERERERESTLLYPEVAAQIALFTSPLWLQNCQSHSQLQWVCVYPPHTVPNMLVWAPAIWPKYYIHLHTCHICHNIITYFL
jgi:hypothetical protein